MGTHAHWSKNRKGLQRIHSLLGPLGNQTSRVSYAFYNHSMLLSSALLSRVLDFFFCRVLTFLSLLLYEPRPASCDGLLCLDVNKVQFLRRRCHSDLLALSVRFLHPVLETFFIRTTTIKHGKRVVPRSKRYFFSKSNTWHILYIELRPICLMPHLTCTKLREHYDSFIISGLA